ncbi:MAG: GLPGLI family protein [Flavobacteriales bacterium]|jgi:GLPGLI family protein
MYMKQVMLLFLYVSFAMVQDNYSQSLSGKVIYKIQFIDNHVDLKNSPDRELIENTIEIANKQTTTLLFNRTQSSTILDQYLIQDTGGNTGLRKWAQKMAFIQTVGSDYFYDKVSNTAVERNNSGTLVKKTNKKLEWDITTESKMIGDYLCYKAIYLDKFINRLGKNTSVPITAWFAPSLPYGFGPKYFNGLPGLILELEDRETTFLASSIIISNESEATIDFPKGKTVSQEDYTKKVMSN